MGRDLVGRQPSRMTQLRSKRSEPPAPRARASGLLHASREWASGRFRALRDRTQALPGEQFDYLSRISRHSSAPTRPLAAPDRTGASGRITPRQNFRGLNLFVVQPQRSPTQARGWSPHDLPTSASLIGPSGSSTFRLSINAMSMSLAGSCFSSESAPGLSIMGFEDEAEQSVSRPCR